LEEEEDDDEEEFFNHDKIDLKRHASLLTTSASCGSRSR